MVNDLIIIGSSAAGMSAALYVARAGINFLIFGQPETGNTAKAGVIENYLGFLSLPGSELSKKFQEHLGKYNPKTVKEKVVSLQKRENNFLVKTEKEEYLAKSVILSTGANPRKLNIPGEEEFLNKGISYCEACDGPLFKDKRVAILGGGNSATKAAFSLSKIAKEVFVLNINDSMRAEKVYLDKLSQLSNVKFFYKVKTFEFFGDSLLEGLRYEQIDSGEKKELSIDGAFIYVGLKPNTGFISQELDIMNEDKEIITDKEGKTKIPGIFAAGDVVDKSFRQISVAVGQGASAAQSAIEFLTKVKEQL